jgi:transcriptional regulator with XRE-family HTH domain
MPAKPLTAEQHQDAQRLRQAFASAQGCDASLTQETLAHLCGWKTQGTVNQYLNGRIPLNLNSLHKFADALKVRPDEISPELAKQGHDLATRYTNDPAPANISEPNKNHAVLPLKEFLELAQLFSDCTPEARIEVMNLARSGAEMSVNKHYPKND